MNQRTNERSTPVHRRQVGVAAIVMLAITVRFLGCQFSETSTTSQDSSPTALSKSKEPDPHQHKYTNALIHETSPYLLQHAHNPVNWYPWGEEAFEKARAEGKCIFLSVGYSTCYWCHVMERESFENEELAAILNEHFIAIKVDREERPDVDEQYMLATQLITRRGGWPNSVWLTPDGRPWMAGTYFPREQFKQILVRLADFWETRHEDVEAQADQLTQAISQSANVSLSLADEDVDQSLIDAAIQAMGRSFDEQHGGFGGAPKFPPHGSLGLLIYEYRRTKQQFLLRMVDGTLDAMARGGVHDHIGGGFHRYSTDRQWLLPHFEKMLYDNAQLARRYTDGYLLTNDERYRRVVADIVAWVQREMTAPDGAFYSAIDSESAGEEGQFYLWDQDELVEVLGKQDAIVFAKVYGFEPRGNFTDEATGRRAGTNIVFLPNPASEFAREKGIDVDAFRARLDEMRIKLLAARNPRPRPHRDDKILAGWNGLMISSLAYAGRTLEEPAYVDAAARAAKFILMSMTDEEGRLLRSYRAGEAKLPAYLDDYAYLADACLELHAATGDNQWVEHAQRLSDILLDDFQDRRAGGFFFTSAAHDELLMRSKSLRGGGNMPSANGVAAQVLLRLGQVTGEPHYTEAAKRTLKSLAGVMRRSPQGAESLVLAAAMLLQPLDRAAGITALGDSTVVPGKSDLRFEKHPVTVDLFASRLTVPPGGTSQIAVSVSIADGWHLYGPNPDVEFVIPTTLRLKPNDVFQTGKVIVPTGKSIKDPVLDETLNVYKGRVWFRLVVTVSEEAEPGASTVELELRTQACDAQRCLPPQTTILKLPITVRANVSPAKTRHEAIFRN